AASHEDDVLGTRERCDLLAVEKVGSDGLDTVGFQVVLQARLGETGNADDAAVRRGALGHAGDGRAHLAGNADNHDVAVKRCEVVDQALVGRRHEIVEFFVTREKVRVALGHGSASYFRSSWGQLPSSQRPRLAATKASSMRSGLSAMA